MNRILILAFVAVALAGCQTKPTRISENEERRVALAKAAGKPIEVSQTTIIIDARPAFDYSTAHIPKSIPMTWSDFSEAKAEQRGILQADRFAIARRLARLGINPDSHVVVVGRGLAGNGEEGRIAWMLAYLGVTNVQFAAIETLNPRYVNTAEAQAPASVAMWKPQEQRSLNATKEELLFAVNNRGSANAISYPKTEAPRFFKIIDVRSERAYLGKEGIGAIKNVPNMDGLNIPWPQFFTKGLRPKPDIAAKLKGVGIKPEDRILVLSEDGVSSAAVTMALRALGFENAANVSGGLNDLLN